MNSEENPTRNIVLQKCPTKFMSIPFRGFFSLYRVTFSLTVLLSINNTHPFTRVTD